MVGSRVHSAPFLLFERPSRSDSVDFHYMVYNTSIIGLQSHGTVVDVTDARGLLVALQDVDRAPVPVHGWDFCACFVVDEKRTYMRR